MLCLTCIFIPHLKTHLMCCSWRLLFCCKPAAVRADLIAAWVSQWLRYSLKTSLQFTVGCVQRGALSVPLYSSPLIEVDVDHGWRQATHPKLAWMTEWITDVNWLKEGCHEDQKDRRHCLAASWTYSNWRPWIPFLSGWRYACESLKLETISK